MDLKAQRAAALKTAEDIINGAKAAARDLTSDEQATVSAKFADIRSLDERIASAKGSDDLMREIEGLGAPQKQEDERGAAKSVGEHFVKSLQGRSIKSMGKFEAPEFKAATDTQAVGTFGGAFGPLVTDIDRSFVMPQRQRLVIADLLPPGTLSGNAVTYPVFPAAIEGGTAMVTEGGAKPQLHIPDPTWQTDALGEVAGHFKITDDMSEDLPYVVSEIENTARYDLLANEEKQLLYGSGTSPQLRGLLNRSGIQTATQGSDSVADAIFKTFAKISTATPFSADAVIMNPQDYEELRLKTDGNGQYFGGGFFQGAYGNGGILTDPPVWGRRTVVTPAIAAGTVVTLATAGGKVLRKGGLRVESTNSHVDDFTNDKITIRLRERLGLQWKYPAAVVKLTLGA